MKNIFTFRKAAISGIFLCALYWIFLILFSQIQISCDAIGYEQLGSMVHKDGWLEYFKTGPNREPLYPFMVSVSMAIADLFSIPYYYIQKILQVLILLCTQILALFLLVRLKVNRVLRLIAVLYIGFSPAIVNSAFSLFSEIAAFPFALGIIMVSVFIWRNIQKLRYRQIVLWSIVSAFVFLGATFAKGIFRHVFTIFLIPYFALMVRAIKNNDRKFARHIGIYLLLTFFTFNSFFISYEWLNFKYNGKFEFSEIYGRLLYGNAAKRAEPLSLRIFLAHLASIPGEGIAKKFFTAEEVQYCSFQASDYFAAQVKFSTGREYLPSAWEKVKEAPFRYLLFMGIEGMRMFFWETTNLGYVAYPAFLQRMFSFAPLKDGIRLILSFLSIISFFWLLAKILHRPREIFDTGSSDKEPIQICFFIMLLLVSYTVLYSLFSVVTRYALPIAPLYILCIAVFFNRSKIKKT